jgi:hypothetical protein
MIKAPGLEVVALKIKEILVQRAGVIAKVLLYRV